MQHTYDRINISPCFLYSLVSKPKDDRLESGNADSGTVILKEELISRLKTGDKVTVQIVVSERDVYRGQEKRRVVTYATRTFTMYSVEDYREKILKNQIAIQDIRAFPLPETEINKLFGPLISRNFFVVRLSVINRENEVKIISTGMITASGRAIVEPLADPDERNIAPSFTVPVTIVPSSLQQTYAIMDDEEVNQIRPRNFRILEFTGALLTAGTAAFGSSLAIAKGVGLFTGVVIPEGKRAIPDRWPGYKRNIVNFAAPDLLKVPGNTIADHKLLFFSKKDIELIVADQNLFANAEEIYNDDVGVFVPSKPNGPKVKIISIAFDNLDIRFEKVFDSGVLTLRQRVAALVAALPKRVERVVNLDTQWVQGGRFGGTTITQADWKNFNDLFNPAKQGDGLRAKYNDALDTLADTDRSDLEPAVGDDLDRLSAVLATFNPKGNTSGYRADLIANQDFGLNALNVSQAKLNDLAKVLAAGPDPIESDVAAIEKTLQLNQKALDFYETAAQILNNNELLQKAAQLNAAATGAVSAEAAAQLTGEADPQKQSLMATAKLAKENFKTIALLFNKIIEREVRSIQSARPGGDMKVMNGVAWFSADESK